MKIDKIIYTISHPETGVIVYVGITQDLESRVRCHYNNPSKQMIAFMDDLKANDLHPVITEIDRGDTKLEDRYIKKFLSEGHPLVNKNSLSWVKLSVRKDESKLNPLSETPKNKFAEDAVISEWHKKHSRGDYTAIGKVTGYSAESIRRFFICRIMPIHVYEFIIQYYEKIETVEIPKITCVYCKEDKEIHQFRKGSLHCIECKGVHRKTYTSEYGKKTGYESQKKYNEKNKEKLIAYQKAYQAKYIRPERRP